MNASELIMFALGASTLVFLVFYKRKIKRLSRWQILVTGFCFMVASWIFTNLEAFFLENFMNFMEHLFNALGILIFAYWSIRSVPFIKGSTENE